jgi:hypothetical protein
MGDDDEKEEEGRGGQLDVIGTGVIARGGE